MLTSPIYWGPLPYRVAMRLLYGVRYESRYRLVSGLLPSNCSVVEFCCGCGFLYERFLSKRGVRYVGIDMLVRMVTRLRKLGGEVIVSDVMVADVSRSDYCIMLGSLYHFYQNEVAVLQRMVNVGDIGILLEPVSNLTTRAIPFISSIAAVLSYIQGTSSSYRIAMDRLDEILFRSRVKIISDDLVLNASYRLVVFSK